MRTTLLSLPATALLAACISTARPRPDSVLAATGGLGKPLSLFVLPTPGGGHPDVVAALDTAAQQVRMVMFHLTDDAVVQALLKARQRGVDVQLILDGGSLATPKFKAAFDTLTLGGVDVRASSSAFSITHEKAFVVDGQVAFIMSANMSKAPFMRDYGVVVADPAVIQEMLAVFDADWQNAAQGTADTPALSAPRLVWSPVDARPRLKELIDSAHATLLATVENLGDPVLSAAFIKAAGRGVQVRMLVPMCDENPNPTINYPYLTKLIAGQVKARVMPAPPAKEHPYMHAKTMVIDGKQAYVGSVNFSTNSTTKARELGIVFEDADAVQTLVSTFEQDWAGAAAVTDPPPTDCPGT